MDPSKEKDQEQTPSTRRKLKIIPIILLVLFLTVICGIAFYYYTSTPEPVQEEPLLREELIDETPLSRLTKQSTDIKTDTPLTTITQQNPDELTEKQSEDSNKPEMILPPEQEEPAQISTCDKPVKQLDEFYTHLDNQDYMSGYKISEPSKIHFSDLIKKLLANPPQVTRESDDLYTILKNTAHFFRISGKDNIIMMKGILDSEKASLEQILSDYYLLVSNPDCNNTSYGNVDKDALYEYACFFLNTMGGRLYLFRRDSLSRMVVTYYAILLVDQANIQNNNRHGIALRAVVDMLISEMETGGSSLKDSELYLDKLYSLKEKYQQ